MTEVFKNKITLILAGMLLVLGLVPMTSPASALDGTLDIQKNVNCGAGSPDNKDGSISLGPDSGAGCNKAKGASNSVENLIKTVINIFSAVVGAVSVIMIIVGGFRYITSGGDSNNVSGAKNTILYAVVGLVIVAIAQIIVQFVLERTTTS